LVQSYLHLEAEAVEKNCLGLPATA
jgi:hypothetical protein